MEQNEKSVQEEKEGILIETVEQIDVDKMDDRKIGSGFEKKNLDGKEVVIHKIELMPKNEMKKTQQENYVYRPVLFRVYYDEVNYETYGGCKQFKRDNGFGAVTFDPDGKNAAARLFRQWLKKQGKKTDEVSRKEFFHGLQGQRAKLKNIVTQFGGKDYPKNIINEFL